MLPDVPTSDEQGLGEFEVAVKYAVFAPKGTPKPVIDKLAAALNEGLDEPQVKKRLAELGADNIVPDRRGPKPLADLVKSEAVRLIPVLEAATGK
jgi:tripartite-type tricarboxylate transporter receptor subunit TctC